MRKRKNDTTAQNPRTSASAKTPPGGSMSLPRLTISALSLVLAGCMATDARFEGQSDELRGYLAQCVETVSGEFGADIPTKELVGTGFTTREFNKLFKIVYADAKYASFHSEEFSYLGGAHGYTRITVGTIDRATGRILRLADVVAEEKLDDLADLLRAEVIKKIGGEENLQGEVKPIDNFYIDKDGLHFIFNQYEVACYAAGSIEIVVDPKSL